MSEKIFVFIFQLVESSLSYQNWSAILNFISYIIITKYWRSATAFMEEKSNLAVH